MRFAFRSLAGQTFAPGASVLPRPPLLLLALGAYAAFVTVAMLVAVAWGITTEQRYTLVTLISSPIAPLSAVLALRAAWLTPRDRRTRCAWTALGLGMAAWSCGDLLPTVVTPDRQAPFASVMDFAYLTYYGLALLATMLLPSGRDIPRRTLALGTLDIGAVVLAGALATWHFVIAPAAEAYAAESYRRLLAFTYPVADLLILALLAAHLLQPRSVAQRQVLLALALSTVVIFAADVNYAHGILSPAGGVTAVWPDIFWMLGKLAVGVAATLHVASLRSALSRTRLDPRVTWLGYLSLVAAFALLASFARSRGPLPPSILAGVAVVTVLVLTRQLVTMRQHGRLLTERAARAHEAQLHALLQHSSDVITLLGPDGAMRLVSPSMQRLFGYEPRALLGSSFTDLLHPADQPLALVYLQQVRGGASGAGEGRLWRLRHARGEWRHVEVVASEHVTGDDTAGIVLNTRDVTERLELEERLRQSQKLESIGQLAGGVAHDFNNLLTIIGCSTDMVLETLAPEHPAYADAQEIRRSADRAAAITAQLLAFGRKQVLRPQQLDLAKVVDETEPMLKRLVTERIRLELVPSRTPCRARVDPTQLQQILLNLAANARDAMPDGGSLRVETGVMQLTQPFACADRTLAPGSYASLVMRDTGTGMDADVLKRLFEPFFTTKPLGQGTGLGLATVHGIVAQSGGAIAVDSVLGLGTTFTVLLPLAVEPAVMEPPAAPARRMASSATRSVVAA